jgi:hypothetical protein
MKTVPGYKDIVPTSSLRHNEPVRRPKNFSREGVLEKALPVFWKYGFAEISLRAAVSSASESGLNAISRMSMAARSSSGIFCVWRQVRKVGVSLVQRFIDGKLLRG